MNPAAVVSLAASPASSKALGEEIAAARGYRCLLYTSDAADERSSVDLGGRRIIKKKKSSNTQRKHLRNYATT